MLGNGLVALFFNMFGNMFSLLDFIHIPYDIISALAGFIVYGNWVVGVDVLAFFVGSVIFWWGVHMSIGIAVWVWGKLPFI